jgi:hypothetical protein
MGADAAFLRDLPDRGSGDRCTTDATQSRHTKGHSGSIYGVGGAISPVTLELVDQTGASWNPVAGWLRSLEHLRRARLGRTPGSSAPRQLIRSQVSREEPIAVVVSQRRVEHVAPSGARRDP